MDDETRAAVKDALVREAIGIGALALILFALGPGRIWVPAFINQVRLRMHPVDTHGPVVRQFASEVSRWDHEQATQQDRGTAAGGPCGCGGLPPVGHRRHPDGDAAGADPLRVRDDRRRAGHLCARRPRHTHDRRRRARHCREGRAAMTKAEAQVFFEEDEDPAPLWALLGAAVESQ